jgi:protein-S-isoprenylcysteine O-methyltransferase Ste14
VAALVVAVAGALLFVASLTYAGYFFAVTLGRTAPPPAVPRISAIAFNIALFTAFALHHSVMARTGAKRWLTRHLVGPRFERTTYVALSSLLFLAVCLAWQPSAGEAWRLSGVWAWAGHAGQVVGLAVIVWAARHLDPLDLTGITQARGSVAGGPNRADATVAPTAAGPYGVVRHPIYTGWILIVACTPLMTVDRLTFAATSTAYLLLAMPWEERSLSAHFGEAYLRYQSRVRWRLFPGVF